MADNHKKASRVEKAAAGMEEDVIRLNDRLKANPDIDHELRLLEALLFAAVEPIDIETLRDRMPEDCDVGALLARLTRDYAGRGMSLVRVADRWRFQTAPDLEPHMVDIKETPRKLSKAALETLAIIAYHQPCALRQRCKGTKPHGGQCFGLRRIGPCLRRFGVWHTVNHPMPIFDQRLCERRIMRPDLHTPFVQTGCGGGDQNKGLVRQAVLNHGSLRIASLLGCDWQA